MFPRIPTPLCLCAALLLGACADVPTQEPGGGVVDPGGGDSGSGGSNGGGGDSGSGARRIEALANAGGQRVTDIDLLFIYDKTLAERLPAGAGAWFEARDELLASGGARLERVSLELPASFASGPLALPEGADGAQRVLLYAGHSQTPEAIDLTGRRRVALRLSADGLGLADL